MWLIKPATNGGATIDVKSECRKSESGSFRSLSRFGRVVSAWVILADFLGCRSVVLGGSFRPIFTCGSIRPWVVSASHVWDSQSTYGMGPYIRGPNAEMKPGLWSYFIDFKHGTGQGQTTQWCTFFKKQKSFTNLPICHEFYELFKQSFPLTLKIPNLNLP